jgi:hypothetical protein
MSVIQSISGVSKQRLRRRGARYDNLVNWSPRFRRRCAYDLRCARALWHRLRGTVISHTADVTKSDLDIAGMMLKYGEHGPEIAIAVVEPFSPRARPET